MNIISYNVNGIRAAMRKGLVDWLKSESPDVICLQETKANKDQVEFDLIENLGYHSYWFSAQKKGYSGVAIFSKIKPNHIEYGSGIDYMDFEGRIIRLDFDKVSIMSLYLPSGTNTDRLDFKFRFMDDFKEYIYSLSNKIENLVICGDYNICHNAIDIHDPVRNKNVSGFLSEEREWLDSFIGDKFLDSFRVINKSPHQYSWWSYRANSRANNKGWRIDYNIVSKSLLNKIEDASILQDVFHSDHCPIKLKLKI
ncbi:exodeoxyribonuclease III [Flavobacteriaceae bacterium]|nr:exodeoxyribonuclease III [Flavobacteriaceae bacterium]MDC0479836.1 exodeoxyribonuclease III [Flavobacteriaceae bacterium]